MFTPQLSISKKTIVPFFIAAAFLCFIPIMPGWNFFWGHVFFLMWLFLQPVLGRKLTVRKTIIFLSLISYLLFNILLITPKLEEHRVLQDSIKLTMLFLSIFIVKECSKGDQVREIIRACTILFPPIFFCYFLLIKEDDWFSYSGRLYDQLFGSPNVFGLFSALALLYMIFQRDYFSKKIFYPVLIGHASILLAGFSRASIIALLIALVISFRKKKFLFLALMVSLLALTSLFFVFQEALPEWVIRKSNLINDIRETGGSSRLLIWKETLSAITSDPISAIFGGGPGRIIIELQWASVDHPHNFYLFITWAYGIIGISIFSIYWLLAFRNISRSSAIDNKLLSSIFIFYTVAFFMDTHILAGQYLALHSLFLGLISMRNQEKEKA